jgi:hypothetical protein
VTENLPAFVVMSTGSGISGGASRRRGRALRGCQGIEPGQGDGNAGGLKESAAVEFHGDISNY